MLKYKQHIVKQKNTIKCGTFAKKTKYNCIEE